MCNYAILEMPLNEIIVELHVIDQQDYTKIDVSWGICVLHIF